MYYQGNVFELRCDASVIPRLMELETKVHMMRVIRIYVNGLCKHDDRYFELDLRDDGRRSKLVLTRYNGVDWVKGKHEHCNKGAIRERALQFLENCGVGWEMGYGLTTEALQHLLKILTKNNRR